VLEFIQSDAGKDCTGLRRRDFIRVGSLSLGGLSLATLTGVRADAAERNFVRDKSIVLLYLSGGASQVETFDPKMEAPKEYRSVTGEVQTKIPGVTFGGTFPRLATMANRLAIIRSHAHNVGDHNKAHVHVLSGGTDPAGDQKRGFSMGSAYTRIRGTNHPLTGLPTYVTMNEVEIDSQYQKENGRFNKGSWPGSLGQAYGPFNHQNGWGEPAKNDKKKKTNPPVPSIENMTLQLPQDQLDKRRRLLNSIDTFRRQLDRSGTMTAMDELSAQAVTLLLGGSTKAFDLAQEDPGTVAMYDTSETQIGHKKFRPSTLGKQMLVARRLCEAGAGFVSVHSAGWDMHADKNNPGMEKGMAMLGTTMDKAVAAFLTDVERRGMSDRILLVVTGDFGRTPKIGKGTGRGHWAKLCPLMFAGGGLQMGQVIGKSNAKAEVPASDPIGLNHMMTTIMHTVFDVGKMRLDPTVPRDMAQLIQNGSPIEELF